MRSIANITAALLLGAAMAGCQNTAPGGEQNAASKTAMSGDVKSSGFDAVLKQAKSELDTQMALPITVPAPKDPGGGYTHEKHKSNATLIYNAGQIYKLTGEEKYADFAGKMLLAYADVYPSWTLHPAKKEQSPGRMFWQNLNESMFLLNVSQSYGAIKDTLSEENKETIETDLLRDMAEFLSDGSPENAFCYFCSGCAKK